MTEEKKNWTDRVFTSVNVLLMIAGLAAVILIWQWIDTRNQIGKLQLELASRLSASESYNKESRQRAAQAMEAERSADVRLGILEKKMAESQNQQIALEAMYQALAQNRDDAALTEVEQVLLIANQQLQLAGNIKSALVALQSADSTLSKIDRGQLVSLRKAVNKDIDRLKGLPFADLVGISLKLDSILSKVEALPLAMEARPSPVRHPVEGESGWMKIGREAWEDIKQLVRIQNMQKPEAPPLSPSQSYFLRENLKLRLLSARLCLLAHDEAGFRSDLKFAQEWINRYFDTNAKETKTALSSLGQIVGSEISIEKLDINESLSAIHNYRVAHDRSGK